MVLDLPWDLCSARDTTINRVANRRSHRSKIGKLVQETSASAALACEVRPVSRLAVGSDVAADANAGGVALLRSFSPAVSDHRRSGFCLGRRRHGGLVGTGLLPPGSHVARRRD